MYFKILYLTLVVYSVSTVKALQCRTCGHWNGPCATQTFDVETCPTSTEHRCMTLRYRLVAIGDESIQRGCVLNDECVRARQDSSLDVLYCGECSYNSCNGGSI